MNTDVAKAICKLTPIDFTELQYLLKPVDPKNYTTVVVKKASDDPIDAVPTLAIDEGQKNLFDLINNSAVRSY